jgi:DNA-binding NtrC family response regulator
LAGNVRELEDVIQEAVIMAERESIPARSLSISRAYLHALIRLSSGDANAA